MYLQGANLQGGVIGNGTGQEISGYVSDEMLMVSPQHYYCIWLGSEQERTGKYEY
jgi:hypothetical protein